MSDELLLISSLFQVGGIYLPRKQEPYLPISYFEILLRLCLLAVKVGGNAQQLHRFLLMYTLVGRANIRSYPEQRSRVLTYIPDLLDLGIVSSKLSI